MSGLNGPQIRDRDTEAPIYEGEFKETC